MKWLIPAVIGGLVLVLGISFARAQKTAVLADEAQAQSAIAVQTEARAKAGNALAAPDRPVPNSNQQAATDPFAQPIAGTTEKPDVPAGEATGPTVGEKPSSPAELRGIADVVGQRAVHIHDHNAPALANLFKKMWPQLADKISVDHRRNVLKFDETLDNAVVVEFLKIVKEQDTDVVNQFLEAVHLAVPKESIQAVKVKDSVMLLGRVDSPDDDRKIVQIAETYFVKVLNYLDVPGRPSPAGAATLPVTVDSQTDTTAQEYRQYEAQCLALAGAIRQRQATAPQDAKAIEQLKVELQGAVHAAFHARQTWQRSQAAQLRTRLEQIERRIADRGQTSSEIIQRRIDDLLNPEKQWEPASDKGLPQTSVVPQKSAGEFPGNAVQNDPASRTFLEFQTESGDPRKGLHDAAHAVTAARAALDEAEAQLTHPEQTLKRIQLTNSNAPGTVSQQTVSDAEAAVVRIQASIQKARISLEIKQRQLKDAQEALAGQVKLLELDLDDAKLRLDYANDELYRAHLLLKNGAVSKEECDAKSLAQRLAASRCKRAEMQLERYRKALPNQAAPADKDQSTIEP